MPERAYLENAITEHKESSSSESVREYNKRIPPTVTINSSNTQMYIKPDESTMQLGPSNLCQQPVSSLAETCIKTYQAPVYSSRSPRQVLQKISSKSKTDQVQVSSRKQSAMTVTTSAVIYVKKEKPRSKKSTCAVNKDKN